MTDVKEVPAKELRFDYRMEGTKIQWDFPGGIGERAATLPELYLWAQIERLQRENDTCGLQCSTAMKSLLAEVEQLKQDVARYESGRVAILAENEHYKQQAADLSAELAIWKQCHSAPKPGQCMPIFDRAGRCGTCTACGANFTCGAKLGSALPPGAGQ